LLPLVGEGADVIWASVQTILVVALYDKTSPNLKYVSFVEEILPLTDIVPSATIGWLLQFGLPPRVFESGARAQKLIWILT
jgi:hypothetical protein